METTNIPSLDMNKQWLELRSSSIHLSFMYTANEGEPQQYCKNTGPLVYNIMCLCSSKKMEL